MGRSHTFLAKCVHWAFVILYAYGIFKQLDDLEQLEDSGLLVFEVVRCVESRPQSAAPREAPPSRTEKPKDTRKWYGSVGLP